jgi:WXG100 family type VII secretion target
MALTHGMNVDAIEKLAKDLKNEAGKVSEISNSVTKLMATAKGNWKGQDADKFDEDWNNSYKKTLSDLAKKLEELGTKAGTNAKQQRDTSSK